MPNPLHDALLAPLAERRHDLMILPDGSRITGPEFLAEIARLAGALVALGLQPGDRVAVQVAKSPRAFALYGATVTAGGVFLPLNTAYTPAEMVHFVTDAEPRFLICDPARAEALGPVAARSGARVLTLAADGSGSLADLAASQPDSFVPVDRGPDDLAGLLYTSGTTGRAKGAMMSHANLLSNAEVLVQSWRFTDRDVLIHALPIYHTHGLYVACNVSLLSGATMIFQPGFDPDAVFAALPQATAMMGVPTFYTRLLDDPRLTRDATAHMRLFVSGSAPLLAETHRAFEDRTGHRILERYGMTETNMNSSNPYDGERRAGTVGFPLPGVEIRITDPETGTELPKGETGMVEVRGPNVFRGYWRMPEKTAEELRENGYFITGDLGRLDDDGYLVIVGRQKDLIITGGLNVYPKEVELVLDEMPAVEESAVVGVPHPDFGEAVVAVLVPAKGASPDTEAIRSTLRDRLAAFKCPKHLEVMPELPRNTMGKVQKNLLRDRFAALFAPEG